jgi:hypothetical protein
MNIYSTHKSGSSKQRQSLRSENFLSTTFLKISSYLAHRTHLGPEKQQGQGQYSTKTDISGRRVFKECFSGMWQADSNLRRPQYPNQLNQHSMHSVGLSNMPSALEAQNSEMIGTSHLMHNLASGYTLIVVFWNQPTATTSIFSSGMKMT